MKTEQQTYGFATRGTPKRIQGKLTTFLDLLGTEEVLTDNSYKITVGWILYLTCGNKTGTEKSLQ